MVTKLTYGSGLGEGISSLGASIGQALQERTKKQRIRDIMKPMVDPNQQPTSNSILGGVVGQPQQQGMTEQEPQQVQKPIPVADQIYNKKMAQVQYLKKQAAALEGEGYHPQAQMMMQEAHQQEQFLQQERLAGMKAEIQRERLGEKKYETERAYHAALGKKGEDEVEGLRTALPKKRLALHMSRKAVESGEVGALSVANLSQRLNMPEIMSAEGKLLQTAAKENLLGNMSRVSAKAQNAWFEKLNYTMMANIGNKKEANLAAQEILEGETFIDEAYLNKRDKLSEEDLKKYGYVRGDVSKRARQETEEIERKIFDRSGYRAQELMEGQESPITLQRRIGKQVVEGTPLTLTMAKEYINRYGDIKTALKVAKKNGYQVPTRDQVEFYNKRPQEIREMLK